MGMSESMDNMLQKPTTAKEVLTILREFFAAVPPTVPYSAALRHAEVLRNNEQRKLWDILSAFRGPDNDDEMMKYATTAVVRHAVFGDKSDVAATAIVAHDKEKSVEIRKTLAEKRQREGFNHFVHHASLAFKALDLNWEGVNDNG